MFKLSNKILFGVMMLTLIVLTQTAAAQNWWDGNYQYRRMISVINQNVTETMTAGVPINVTLNHNTIVGAGKSLASGEDVRIVWGNSSESALIELDRINITPFNMVNTTLAFTLPQDIASDTTSLNFTMYYGYPGAGAAPKDGKRANDNSTAFYIFQNGIVEDIAGNNTGTLYGTVDIVGGRRGDAFDFDGTNDYINLTNPDGDLDIDRTDNVTFEAWVNTGASGVYTIASKYDLEAERGWIFQVVHTNVTLLMRSSIGNSMKAAGDITVNEGEWTHVAVSYPGTSSASDIRFFVNGEESATIVEDDTLSSSITIAGEAQLGEISGIQRFNGTMDDVRIKKQNPHNLHYASPEAVTSLGIEQEDEFITLVAPGNTTFYTTSIDLEVSSTVAMDTWIYNLDDTGNVTFTPNTTITALGGTHELVVWGNETGGDIAEVSVIFYVFMGLNVTAYGNTSGEISNWILTASNGSFNATFLNNNNPQLIDQANLPTGLTNVTVNDGSTSLFFHNLTTELLINNTVITPLLFNLSQKAENPVSLTIDPGTTVSTNTEITATCSAPEGTVILRRDGVTVTNPSTFTSPAGSYLMNCSVEQETANYRPASTSSTVTVTSGVQGCTNSSIYAFSYTFSDITEDITAFDFSSFVALNLTKPDLSDVKADVTMFKNHTAGYFVVVNTSNISSVTLEWGNYLANITYQESHYNQSVVSITDYSEQNPYYFFTVYDEIAQTESLPPGINRTTARIECSLGSSLIDINDSRFLIPTITTATEAVINVQYPSTEYIRSYLLGSDVVYKDIYLADATAYTLYQIPIEMLDFLYWGAEIELYKNAVGGEIIITEGNFDADHIFNAYLIKDEKYRLRLVTPTETRIIGFLFAVAPGVQQISISQITLQPDVSLINDHLTIAAEIINSTSTLMVQYFDDTSQTDSVEFIVYEGANQTPFFETTVVGSSNITLTIPGVNITQRYAVHAIVTHQVFGNSPVNFVIGVGAFGNLVSLGPSVAAWFYQAASVALIFFVATIITPRIKLAGMLIMGAMIGILWYIGWFVVATGAVVLMIAFIALAMASELKKRGRV